MKKIILLFATLLTTSSLLAQSSVVKGSLIDSYSAEGVIGAIVEMQSLNSTVAPTLTTSGYEGAFTFNSIAYGDYVVKASFMGYQDYVDTIKVNSPRLMLDKLRIKEASTQIDAVVKEVQAMRTSQKGDTLSYSASAFKVSDDADVEGLLKKMPGITIVDGEVSAQGETVQKIFVDGREFFGSDVTTAISSLPAEVVDNIEVYDKLSDNAALSGMDDGEGYKAINIVTKSHMREGFFGKVYAGGGYQPDAEGELSKYKYMAGGNVNYFKGKHRISVLALFNNINQQSFSFDDILGVTDSRKSASQYMLRPQSGVAEVGAIGLNYTSAFGKDDKVKVEGSYFYNGTATENEQIKERWYEDPLDDNTQYTETNSLTYNYNHRINGNVEWQITPTQKVVFRQTTSLQYNDSESLTEGYMYGESGYSVLDSYSYADKGGYNSTSHLSHMVRLGKAGRTLSTNVKYYISSQQENVTDNFSNSASGITDQTVTYADIAALEAMYEGTNVLRDYYYTRVFSPTSTNTVSGNITYAEPIGKSMQLNFKYDFSHKDQDTEKITYETDSDYENLVLQPSASNHYQTNYMVHQFGPGVYFVKDKSKFSARVNYQLSELTGDVVLAGTDKTSSPINHTFNNVTFFSMAKIFFNQTNSLRARLYSKTDSPWVGYLADAYDVSDVQYITHGNTSLVPSYITTLRMHYVRSNVEKGSTLMIMGGFENQKDYIGDHIVYSPGTVTLDGISYEPLEYSTYVNLDDYWSYHAQIEYGFPIPLIKCNFNLKGGVEYTLTPSLIGGTIDETTGLIEGGELNKTSDMTYSFTSVLGSNISENVDFTLSWTGEYSQAANSASTSSDTNTYLSQTASASMKFVFLGGFTFTGAATYQGYYGITNDYDETYLLCNASIGRKIFRNKRGELSLGVNDIFDQNTSFTRTVGTGYTQNTYNSTIGRYYSLKLVYNLRSFGQKGGQRGEGGMGGPGMGRGMGPGGGGPPMM